MSRNLLVLGTAAVAFGNMAHADVPSVATDIAPVHSLVSRVMDGLGTPSLIVQPGATPHEYSLRPSEAAALQDADLVFWIGPDLTPWLGSAIETLSGDASVTAFLDIEDTTRLPFREGVMFEHDHADATEDDDDHDQAEEEHGHDDHADDEHEHGAQAHDEHGHEEDEHDHARDDHGDHEAHDDDHAAHDDGHEDHEGHDHAHGAYDPHAWLSLDNAAAWLNVIAAELSAADPDNAGVYFANAAEGRAELSALAAEIVALLDPVRDQRFIVFHDAYQYFETSFGIAAAGAISLSDAAEPGPARIAEIQAQIAEDDIACVLAEPQFNPALVDTVLAGSDAATAVIDPIGVDLDLGPTQYPDMLRAMARSLAECL